MPKKVSPPFHVAPMQVVIGEPVTDPEEIAAMERVRKRLKRGQRKKPWHIAPMQIVVAEVVTDPAEIAAMERMRERLKQKKQRARATRARGKPDSATKKKA